ncbi:MAG: FadR/GntR family transcriptional regulator [Sphaerochaeta sp.]
MKEIKRIPVTTQVIDSIKESIINGSYSIGSKLPPEIKLCEMLNVSRSTVREAMRSLQAEGYVELVAGKGAFVRDNQSHDYDTVRTWFIESAPSLKDSTEVREALETLQIKMAVKRGTPEELEELKAIHQRFIEENKDNNVPALAALDEQFHTQICKMAHNPLLSKINILTAMELKKYRILSISVKSSSENTIREHELILHALEERDTQKASAYMLAHLGSSLSDINKVLDGQK